MNNDTKKYFEQLKKEINSAYEIAKKARALNLDPSDGVEAIPAGDLASRVEGLVGPEGIAEKIKEIGRSNTTGIIDWLLRDITPTSGKEEKVKIIDQALRTSLAILTEGVVAAPLEGISKVEINSNPDGTTYLSIFFSGPIRSAGGTAQGLAVLVGEYIRRKIGLKEYRPTKDELERYVEEINIYHQRCSRLQYFPSEEDIRTIVKNLGVCVDGDPTEKLEVAIHRDLKRVESNRVRGGMCLVTAEGVAQKARKIFGYANSFKVDWNWLTELGKKKTSSGDSKLDDKQAVFMKEVVGGRPIFSEPSTKGGFRLHYGRSRASGIAGKCIHPAAMILLDGFPATGTQLKLEKPGKGCIVTECTEIEGPLIKTKNGDVLRVETREQAIELMDELDEIIFLGDMLVSYGDFLQTNSQLLPAGFCDGWWSLIAKEAGIKNTGEPTSNEAIQLSLKHDIPLHPKYTYNWEDIEIPDIQQLAEWISKGEIDGHLILDYEVKLKRIMELSGIPHKKIKEKLMVEDYPPLLSQLGLEADGKKITVKKPLNLQYAKDSFTLVESVSLTKIKQKSGTYIGARMGRPEKSRERKMKPPVHSLFPIGFHGGPQRLVNKAAEKKNISIDTAQYYCPSCKNKSTHTSCMDCETPTILVKSCPTCGLISDEESCPRCHVKIKYSKQSNIDLHTKWRQAIEKIGNVTEVKGVQGMISEFKIPEPLEKGLLRALNDVFVFKDGTIRHDSTDAPITHFKPKEADVTIEELKKLGYTHDYLGKKLENIEQILELKVQDVLLPQDADKYLFRVSKFIDQLLIKFYGQEPFYKLETPRDLLGQLIIGLAPHTSAGVTGRIIGFNNARVCFAHPYWHANKRRNADGDEDSIMLLLDVLLNFSRKYLPAARGGKMDAPLVVTTVLDPKEVDDEAHKLEVVKEYSIDFYEKTWEQVWPDQVEVKTVSSLLEDNPYSELYFTHSTDDITGPVTESSYVTSGSMAEKVKRQLALAEKIRAVDEWGVANVLINSHFLRDTYGNLRAFTRQRVRCVKCNENYRRPPLKGKCLKCGGKLILTVSKGNIVKYLDISMDLAENYGLSIYLKQRLKLLKGEVNSLFTNELDRQVSISDFM